MRAIDVHAHPSTKEEFALLKPFFEAMKKYYPFEFPVRTEEEMAQDFRDCDVKAILVATDAETATGLPAVTNDYIARVTRKYPDVYAGGFGSVDPWKGKMAVKEAERAIKELGLMGIKFAPAIQAFYPNDRRFYPLWEKCTELKTHIQLHTGTTGIGAGLPGGGGIHLKWCRPIPYIDDVAADFPDLDIIALHPSWPWQEEMIAVAIHKRNVYIELSGWMPKYFPQSLKHEINRRLQDKVMFGSDYPGINPRAWLDQFESEGYKPEVIEKVFYKNAERILGIKV